ncbi:MAG: cation:proton antiporter [Clostridiales bacterium]|jgi:CPA2 family monovalent cation:H+ antiporter-2|nr:cation:proton antiporter [Clostridiales bacterium]
MLIPPLIKDLTLMLLVAGVMTLLCKKLRQPVVLGYILAGIITGPHFHFFPDVIDIHSIETWGEIGIIILMFSLGLEFNLHKLASVGGTAIITAITTMGAMILIGTGVGQLLGWTMLNSIFLGCMLSMSSTTIIIKAFNDLDLRKKRFTEIVFGALIIEDIAGIFIMVALSTIFVSQGISGGELSITLVKMVLYLALWLIVGIYLIPSVLKKTLKLMNDETLLVVSLGMCFGMALLAGYLGFSTALGAFLAGSLLAGTIHAERVEHLNKPVKDLFGAVFFISVGMLVQFDIIVQYALPILILTLVTILGQSLFSTIGVTLSGQSLKTAVFCGCSLVQIGEFSFIIATLGKNMGVTGDFLYPIIVAVSVITIFTTPFVMKAAPKVYNLLSKILPAKLTAYLNRHSAEDQQEREQDSDWRAFIKTYFSHLGIDLVIIAGTISVGIFTLWPFLQQHFQPLLASIMTEAAIILVMAPFLRQLLFRRNENILSLALKSKSNRLPLFALLILRLALLILAVMIPIRVIFDFPTVYLLLAALVIVVVITRSDWLISPYLSIEARFLANFNERQLEERRGILHDSRWLDQNVYVSSFICAPDMPGINQRLSELRWTNRIKVIKIIRKNHHINIPEGKERLHPGDLVFLIASEKQLDMMQNMLTVELRKDPEKGYCTMHDFITHQEQYPEADQLLSYALYVEKDSLLIGQKIRDSGIKSDWGCLLLGLERQLYPMVFPDINMRIQANDLIWLIGSQKMTGHIVKADLV